MSENSRAAPPPPRCANRLRWGLLLLGVALTGNLLDLVCRCTETAAATPYETFLLIFQAGVCGILLVLILLVALLPAIQAKKAASPRRPRRRYGSQQPVS